MCKERATERAYINTDNKPKTVKCQQKVNLGKGNISALCTIFILATLLWIWSHLQVKLTEDRQINIGLYSPYHFLLSTSKMRKQYSPHLQCAGLSVPSHYLPALPSLPALWGPLFFLWWPGPAPVSQTCILCGTTLSYHPPTPRRDWAPLCRFGIHPSQSFPCIFCSQLCYAWHSPHRTVARPSHRARCRAPHATLARRQGRWHVVLDCLFEMTEWAFFSGGGSAQEANLFLTTGWIVSRLARDVLGTGALLFGWVHGGLVGRGSWKPKSYSCTKGQEAEKVRYKWGARLSNSQRPRSYMVYVDSSNTFQCIKDLMPMRMKKSSNTVKFSLQKGIQLPNVHIYN